MNQSIAFALKKSETDRLVNLYFALNENSSFSRWSTLLFSLQPQYSKRIADK